MLKNYLKIALKVLVRRKFFTFISLFGISFTLVVLMVVTAMLDHMLAPMTPESRQDRTIGVYRAVMFGERGGWSSRAGYKLLDKYARGLEGVERLSIFSGGNNVSSYLNGQKITSTLKRTDGEFWQILDFTFLEGAPYTAADVEHAAFVAVINQTTKRRFFGDGPAVGRSLEADGQRFRVVGVVPDVSRVRFVPFSDIWVPTTTSKSDAYKRDLVGDFLAIALAKTPDALPRIREEFNSRLAHIELDDPKTYMTMVAPFETKYDSWAREAPFVGNPRDPRVQGWKLTLLLTGLGLLFMLLPTVNLININVSRIMERASEIGVRKAFGASSRTLVGQFIVENIILTLVGGVFGLALSFFVLRALSASGYIQYAQFHINFRIFVYGVALAAFFGLLSGVYPAWRMSRMNPVQALKGASR
jgi:putative ABC transport system permease protein